MLSLIVASAFATFPIQIGDALVHPRNLLVHLREPEVQSRLRSGGFHILKYLPQIDVAIVEAPGGKLQATRQELGALDGVEFADFDRAARLAYVPNDTNWPSMWHFVTIKADLAWDISRGTATKVAIIDTGGETTHPDLLPNLWTNPGEIPGNGIDDDSNGYVDDVNGFDFAYNDGVPDDIFGHGTSCAGIVGAAQDNNLGVTGVAPNARIMVLKTCNNSGYLYDSANVPAYIYGADMGARVFSMSYYSDRVSRSERLAMNYAVSKGVVPCGAAANDNTVFPYYPAAYPNVVSVAATDTANNRAGFSNWGPSTVDVAAPGVSLWTTALNAGYTGGFGGTSGATPHVAGLATLLFGAYPSASATQVRAAIEDTCTPLAWDFSNHGLVNSLAAMQAMANPVAQQPAVVRFASPLGIDPSNTKRPGETVIGGRGFGSPRKVQVFQGKNEVPILRRNRDTIVVGAVPMSAPIKILVNNTLVRTLPTIDGAAFAYPLIEASTQGAGLSGGFAEAAKVDGSAIIAGRRSDERAFIHATFQNVTKGAKLTLILRYRVIGVTDQNFQVQIYNWSVASYPYGTWTTLSNEAGSASYTTLKLPIGDISPFVDDEGTTYLRLQTTAGLPAGAELQVDQCYLGIETAGRR